MPTNKDLARVEAHLRKVLEERLERGDSLNPMIYGFLCWGSSLSKDPGPSIQDDGCQACLLGSAVIDELQRGRRLERGNEYEVAAQVLEIDEEASGGLEAGFLSHSAKEAKISGPWALLGYRLRQDYYDTTDSTDLQDPSSP